MRRRTISIRTMTAATLMVFVLTVFTTSGRLGACSCGPLTDQQALEFADAVFVGSLAEIITPPGGNYSSDDPERFVFEVDAVYRGQVFARQSVVTARDGASCGLEISGTGPFLVFARAPDTSTDDAVDGELTSSLCSGTRAVEPAGPPVGFGDASPPLPGASPVGSTSAGTPTTPIVAIVGAVVVAGFAVLLVIRSRATARRLAPPPTM